MFLFIKLDVMYDDSEFYILISSLSDIDFV